MKKTLLTTTILAFSGLAHAYPDLPTAFKNGGGTLIGDTAYVGLGSADDVFYTLDLSQTDGQWQSIAAFPGGKRDQPVVTALDGKLYVFGGLQTNDKGELQLVNDAYVYDPVAQSWQKLPTRSPFGVVGASAVAHGKRIYFIGGVNEAIFNGYFQDYTAAADDDAKAAVAKAYFEQRAQDYFFNRNLFSYEPASNRWYNEGLMPFDGRAGAAVAGNGDSFIVANGEIKPGLRTDAVAQGTFNGEGTVQWQDLPALIAGKDAAEQEGVAGAYSGYSHGHYLLAGGANFPGAKAQYAAGKLKAHDGLSKVHHSDVFTFDGSAWQHIGNLPVGAGYGVSISYGDKLLLIGGGTDGEPLSSVTTLDYDNGKLTVE